MRRIAFCTILVCVLAGFLGGCASDSVQSISQPATAVPGEAKAPGEVTPGMGPAGPSANVRF